MKTKQFVTILIGGFLLLALSINGTAKENSIHTAFNQTKDKKAQFPGGKAELKKWLKENMDYPEDAKRYGTVVVEFTVKKNGKLADFRIHKGVNDQLDVLAVEILRGMPKWEPAMKGGKEVDSKVQLPVKFVLISEKGSLNEDEETED